MKLRPIRLLTFLTAVCAVVCVIYIGFVALKRDTTAPQIRLPSDALPISVHDGQDVLLAGVTAEDDRDGDVTDSLLVQGLSSVRSDHTATVTYVAFDKAGNVAKAVRTVRYTDYVSPRFSLTEPLVFTGNGALNLLSKVMATDLLDGDLSGKIKGGLVGQTTSLTEVGTHQVELRVTNSMGDTSRITVPVEVIAVGTYNAAVALTENLIYVEKGTQFVPESYLHSVICGGVIYSAQQLPQEAVVDIASGVRTDTCGVYAVDYTVTVGSFTGFTRLIVVVEENA